MTESIGLLAKILLLSLGISLVIKYVGPLVPIPATSSVALILILGPCIIMVGFLGWRALQTNGNHSNC